MRIRLIMLGKTGRAEIRALLEGYLARLRHHAAIEITELRDNSTAARKLRVDPAATLVLLDAAGKPFTSEQFARWLAQHRDCGSRELIFLCGDAAGFPEALRRKASQKISLSSLTFSHELARVMLAEQLYRAFTLLAGHPYPK